MARKTDIWAKAWVSIGLVCDPYGSLSAKWLGCFPTCYDAMKAADDSGCFQSYQHMVAWQRSLSDSQPSVMGYGYVVAPSITGMSVIPVLTDGQWSREKATQQLYHLLKHYTDRGGVVAGHGIGYLVDAKPNKEHK